MILIIKRNPGYFDWVLFKFIKDLLLLFSIQLFFFSAELRIISFTFKSIKKQLKHDPTKCYVMSPIVVP